MTAATARRSAEHEKKHRKNGGDWPPSDRQFIQVQQTIPSHHQKPLLLSQREI